MAMIDVLETGIEGLLELTPKVFVDERGYFFESYNEQVLREAGIHQTFVQDNESKSTRGVLRGLHMQLEKPQAKLVRVVAGEVFDVAVDVRLKSPTFGKWYGLILSGENKKQFYIPKGFLHGFLVLSEEAIFTYKCSDYYDPDGEFGVYFNDKNIAIDWPIHSVGDLTVSNKDARNKSLVELKHILEKQGSI